MLKILLFLSVFSHFCVSNEETLDTGTVGCEDYKDFVTNSNFLVDKTLLIKELIKRPNVNFLITRPRRWGKTLSLSMIKYFFNQEVDDQGKPLSPQPNRFLFEGSSDQGIPKSKLAQDTLWNSTYSPEQGSRPVIFISLKNISARTYQEMLSSVEVLFVNLFSEYKYLHDVSGFWRDSNRMRKEFRAKIKDLINYDLSQGLLLLSEMLYQHHSKKVLVLIDEYDTPIISAYYNGYLEEALHFMKKLFQATLKTNNYVQRGVMTGIYRIARASLFSGLNNFVEDNLVQSSKFHKHYGFLQEEVEQLLVDSKLGLEYTDQIRSFYNGYNVGGLQVYNPWSVLLFIETRSLIPHWVNTADNSLICSLLDNEIQEEVSSLVQGNSVTKLLDVEDTVLSLEGESVWLLLLYTGYLTLKDFPVYLDGQCRLSFVVPNQEVNTLLNNKILKCRLKKPILSRAKVQRVKAVFRAIVQGKFKEVVETFYGGGEIQFLGNWNFTYLHIAALQNTAVDFIVLRDSSLLNCTDSEGLLPADYAFMGGQGVLQEYSSFLQKPLHWQALYCSYGKNLFFTLGAFGTLTKALYDVVFPQGNLHWTGCLYWTRKLLVSLAVYAVDQALKSVFAETCGGVQRYFAVDVSRPLEMSSLVQFQKYVLENQGAYVTATDCKQGYSRVASLLKSVLESVSITFTLCH